MKVKIKIMGDFLILITLDRFFAITLAPFGIYVKSEQPCRHPLTLRHELTHWKQQMEMGIIFFYLWYFIEWLIKLLWFGKDAYYHISFEKEAYFSQVISDYNSKRRRFAWFKFIFKTPTVNDIKGRRKL